MFRKFACISCITLAALLPAASFAAGPTGAVGTSIGPRIGFSSGPDQFLFGGQMSIGEVAPKLSFDPSLELGFGDNRTVFAGNFDLHYHFVTSTTWKPYLGAGATVSVIDFSNDHFGDRDNETDVGGAVIFGAGAPTRSGNQFFGELKLGLGDVPDLRFVVGWNFKM